MSKRDGHVRVLPIHVANKIAAGEVVERPASVVKELVENAIDAGSRKITITITQGGRKLVAVQDDGCGMTKDDAVMSLERQATSKILDVDDIERIDTLGFRGEAIPSIASVSRFTLTTRRADSDEGTTLTVNAGTLAEVRSAGCPAGTLVEVRDLFCNVPARRKFLRAYATEEAHVKTIFTTHALAHPDIGFTLQVDGREIYRLAPAKNLAERVRDLFGDEFLENCLPISSDETEDRSAKVSGFIERPNREMPSRRDQYIFVNGRPATAPSVAYAMREAYPKQPGEVKPAAILFLEMPPESVDVNVHPTKREVRFRDNVAVKSAIIAAIENALFKRTETITTPIAPCAERQDGGVKQMPRTADEKPSVRVEPTPNPAPVATPIPIRPAPIEMELPVVSECGSSAKPWNWFRFLAMTASGYLLVETDTGVVTINPHAARERIAFEALTRDGASRGTSQNLLIPETVRLSPPDFARVKASLDTIRTLGFTIDEFGTDTFKIDAVPQLIGELSPSAVISTIARDLADGLVRQGRERWREDLIAKSVARSYAGMNLKLDEAGATKLVEELAMTSMPYVCPRGKPIMIFTSNRDLDRKFSR